MDGGDQINFTPRQCRASAGFSLLEVLIALVILSVGLLGIAALISTALKSNDSAYIRTQATTLAYNIIDRMRANLPAANNLGYNVTMPASAVTTASPPVDTCTVGSCSTAQLATNDLTQWEYDLATRLPQGRGAIAATTAAGIVNVTVTVLWNDSRAHDSLQKSGAPTATTFSLSVSSALP
ncbi:MAG: type IV pilus modification protein PilV [Gammaproteobacteria bacterium]